MKTKSALLIASLLLQVVLVWSQGNLMITPTRVLIVKPNQTEQISLRNTGEDTVMYSISFVNKKMTEEGGFEMISESDTGKLFSDAYVRVFPRKVVLGPRETQTVKVQFKKQPNMTDGEYRSHLYFRDEKKNLPKGSDLNKNTDTSALGIDLIPVFGITIPIIVRVGELTSGITISDVKLETAYDGIPQIKMTLNRTGNKSVYGTIVVKYQEPDGKTVEIGMVKGVGVYTDITKRNYTLRLPKAKGKAMDKGKIMVSYTNEENNAKEMLFETSIDL